MAGSTPDPPATAWHPQLGEDHWRSLVEQVGDYAIFMLDPSGHAVTWNQGVERMLGYSEREFVGLPSWRLFPVPARASRAPEIEFETAARDGRASDDRWMLRKDGSEFWASGITTALRDESGRLIGFTKVMRDHTSERQSEQALRASEERLRETEHRLMTALAAARMGTWRWNLLTNEEDLDKGLSRILGLEAPESVRTIQDVLDRVHPEGHGARLHGHRAASRLQPAADAPAPGPGSERRPGAAPTDPPALVGRRQAAGPVVRAGPVADLCRPGSDRAGADQPRAQRAGCHDARRPIGHSG